MAKKTLIQLSLFLFLSVVFSACGEGTGDTLAKIRKERTVHVGTVPFEAPLLYQMGMDLVGPEAELVKRLVQRIQETAAEPGKEIQINWANRSYGALVRALMDHEIDMVAAVFAITDQRKSEIDFSEPYYQPKLVLAINPVHKDLEPDQLDGASIGVRGETGVQDAVRARFTASKIVSFGTLDDALLALRRKEVDAVIDDQHMVEYALATTTGMAHMEYIPEVIETLNCGLAFRKGDQPLRELADSVIAEIKTENLYAQWLEQHQDDRMKKVASRREIRLEEAQRAVEPRQVTIRISKDSNFDFDIYRMANLQFILKNQTSGSSYNTSRIDFRGPVGYAGTKVPPGTYTLSLPKFNFSAVIQITPSDPGQVPINIRLKSGGELDIRKG